MSGLNVEYLNSICFVSIDNKEAGQSFGPVQAEILIKHLKSKEMKQIQGLVWSTPQNSIFCSGGNLKFYKGQKQKRAGLLANRRISYALKLLTAVPVPTVAIVDGDAFGGGVELLSGFDFVLSSPKSLFGLWQRRIGLVFGWGGGSRLEARLGLKKIRQYALLAQTFSAYEAASIGLVDEIVPRELLQNKALEIIRSSKSISNSPVRSIKTWTSSREQSLFKKLWFNPDHKKILNSYPGNLSEGELL